MILVDIYIPAIEQMYDFRLEESCCPDVLIGEISEMVEQKEQMISGGQETFFLFDASQQCMIPHGKTLAQSGVADGHLLILV